MQSNLTPGDFEVLQHELLERKAQLQRAITREPGAPTNTAQLERDRHELVEVDAALERVAVGTYGFCLRCGKPMDRARLQLFPAARFEYLIERIRELTGDPGRTEVLNASLTWFASTSGNCASVGGAGFAQAVVNNSASSPARVFMRRILAYYAQ